MSIGRLVYEKKITIIIEKKYIERVKNWKEMTIL